MTANTFADGLDNAIAGLVSIDVSGGSDGFIIKQSERRWFYSDGEEIYPLIQHPRIKTVEFADPLILDWSDAETIFVELTDDTTVEHTNAVPGQRFKFGS